MFSSLITSTIWCESKEVKILWVTMLALTNKHSRMDASVPGLVKMSGLTLSEVEASLAVLEAPDPYSRSTEHEGRRIQKVDGGWLILNHAKYRKKMDADDRREYLRIKKQEYRMAKKNAEANGLTPMFKPKLNKTLGEKLEDDRDPNEQA